MVTHSRPSWLLRRLIEQPSRPLQSILLILQSPPIITTEGINGDRLDRRRPCSQLLPVHLRVHAISHMPRLRLPALALDPLRQTTPDAPLRGNDLVGGGESRCAASAGSGGGGYGCGGALGAGQRGSRLRREGGDLGAPDVDAGLFVGGEVRTGRRLG